MNCDVWNTKTFARRRLPAGGASQTRPDGDVDTIVRLRALTLTDGRGGALTAAPARLETRVWMPFATPRTDVTVRMTRSTEVFGGGGGGGDGAASAAPAGASSPSSAAASSWLSPAAAAATSAAPTGIALQVTPAQYAQLLRTVSQNFAPLEYSVEALAVDEFSGLCVPPSTFPSFFCFVP
jgi:hypothetical protein